MLKNKVLKHPYYTTFQNVRCGSTFLCGTNCALHVKLSGQFKIQDSTGLSSTVNSINLENTNLVHVDPNSPVSTEENYCQTTTVTYTGTSSFDERIK